MAAIQRQAPTSVRVGDSDSNCSMIWLTFSSLIRSSAPTSSAAIGGALAATGGPSAASARAASATAARSSGSGGGAAVDWVTLRLPDALVLVELDGAGVERD